MSYHIVEITDKSDTLKIMGFEERNPYLYPQSEQIYDFEITISGVKHYQRNKLYNFIGDAGGKIRTIYYEFPYRYESVQEIYYETPYINKVASLHLVQELIGSNYGDIEKITSQKTLRHFRIIDQDSVVDVLSETEPVIRMAKDLGVTDILHKQMKQ